MIHTADRPGWLSANALRVSVCSCSYNNSVSAVRGPAVRTCAKEQGGLICGSGLPDCLAALWAMRCHRARRSAWRSSGRWATVEAETNGIIVCTPSSVAFSMTRSILWPFSRPRARVRQKEAWASGVAAVTAISAVSEEKCVIWPWYSVPFSSRKTTLSPV